MKSKFGRPILAFTLCMAVAMTTMVTTSCSSAQALTDVERFHPVVTDVLVLACTVSPSAALCGTAKATIENDYNLVVTLWGDYNAAVANGTATPGMWNDLNAAFATFEKDSADIFALGLGLNAPEITAIVASAQVLLAAIESLFPASPTGQAKSAVFASHAVGRTSYDSQWLKTWSADFNGKLDVAHKIHPSAHVEKVHYHGKAMRYLTLGIEK